jgi:hypothetical protein
LLFVRARSACGSDDNRTIISFNWASTAAFTFEAITSTPYALEVAADGPETWWLRGTADPRLGPTGGNPLSCPNSGTPCQLVRGSPLSQPFGLAPPHI